jgi:hypothetical protein
MQTKEKPSAKSVVIAIKALRKAEKLNLVKRAEEIRLALKESNN